jgi:Uri superfamily endonuclease
MIDRFPADKGSYLLWFFLPRGADLTIGKLGRHHFKRGWYLYCGSAFGAGGLRARIGHHLKPSEKKHWHVDYLKSEANIRSVWFCRGENNEHDWSKKLSTLPGANFPVIGFGSSDCDCRSHLIYLSRKPSSKNVQELLSGLVKIARRNVLEPIS